MKPALSLTRRLTFLFAASSSAVLLGLGWMIGHSIEQHFEEQDRFVLKARLHMAESLLSRMNTRSDISRLPEHFAEAGTGHHDAALLVIGANQKILYASSKLTFPDAILNRDSLPERLIIWNDNGTDYRGISALIPSSLDKQSPVLVAVAVDIEHHKMFMQVFMRTLWLFVACAALATGMLGWFAASRGLSPLREMRERAEVISASSLDNRLPVEAVPAELAQLAQTLNEMLARLQDAFTRLSHFSSDLAHELRTPINNLMMQAQVSLSRERDAARYREILESSMEEYERLSRMISDMLFLAKAEKDTRLARKEPVDLGNEVGDLFDFYEALAEEKKIRMRRSGTVLISGDKLMLRRALNNLLSNAIRHTPYEGFVTVEITENGRHAEIKVENSGDPIPPEHLQRIFERFYRVDSSRQQVSGEGTGLGLAITQAIIKAHHGEITARSENGTTVFRISLPLEEKNQ